MSAVSAISPFPGAPEAPATTQPPLPSFGDLFHGLLEIVNPLQHIPIISTIYRKLTGDQINPVERIAGDTLYGGVLGFASSLANVMFQQATGKDFGDTALAMLHIGDDDKATALAKNDASSGPSISSDSSSSRVATAAPAQLIGGTAANAATPKPIPDAKDVLLASLDRSWIGPDLDEQLNSSASGLSVKSEPTQNSVTLLASLDRNASDFGLDQPATPSLALVAPRKLPQSLSSGDETALMASLNKSGISSDLTMRAMYAYRKTMGLPASAVQTPAQ
jgi:hypothetical protein